MPETRWPVLVTYVYHSGPAIFTKSVAHSFQLPQMLKTLSNICCAYRLSETNGAVTSRNQKRIYHLYDFFTVFFCGLISLEFSPSY